MEEEIKREEVRNVVRRLKEGKAVDVDEIPGEMWRYGWEEVEKRLWELCNRVWKGEGCPREWNGMKRLLCRLGRRGKAK